LNLLEQNFLEASRNLADRENIEREKQRQQELEAAHKLAELEKQRAEEQTKTAARLKIRSFLLASLFLIAVILATAALIRLAPIGGRSGSESQPAPGKFSPTTQSGWTGRPGSGPGIGIYSDEKSTG
jgi:hypothetical protein